MARRTLAVLTVLAAVAVAAAPALAGKHTFHVGKGQTKGPLTITNPPYNKVVNNGKITNKGKNGVPALTVTGGSSSVVNNGVISSTVTSHGSSVAIGVQQGN